MADRTLNVKILGDATSLERALGRSGESAKGFNATLGRLSVGFGQLAKGVLVIDAVQKAIEGLTASVHLGIEEFRDQAKISAQTAAALKSTGGIAGVTADHIDRLAHSLSDLSGIDDEAIKSSENVLLSFTNIRNSLGKNNDIFDRATRAVADFSARSGKDAPAAAVLLGKALEDPARRIWILARAGIVFTTQQQKQIKAIEASKGILAAQKIVLGELTDRFGGAAKAAGETLPGALNILKERFKDLAGQGVGAVAEPLRRATVGLKDFVVKLTEAHGFHAKLDVAVSGIENLGRTLLDQLRAQFESIDFHDLAREIGQRLGAIDWKAEISRAARALSQAFVAGLARLTTAIKAVDWNKVGREVARGIGLAIGAVVEFLASVHWNAVADAIERLIVAAIKAAGSLFLGVGQVIGGFLLKGITNGLAAAGVAIERLAVRIALKIVEPFSHLPKFLGGGVFQSLKATLEDKLPAAISSQRLFDAVAASGAALGQGFAAGIARGVAAGQDALTSTVETQMKVAAAVAQAAVSPTAAASPLSPPGADLGPHPKRRKGITVSQRNTFFDNTIGRLLDQASDGTIRQQIAKLQQVGALITARIAATRDVTRRLTLEQELLDQVTRPIAALKTQARQDAIQKSQDAFTALLARLQLGVDRSAVTTSLQDDLSALDVEQTAIRSRIKAVGKTTDLEEQLLGVQNQRRAILKQIQQNVVTARNAAQFKKIGLTATGDTVVPGAKSLKAELGNVADALQGTFLDTTKTKSLIQHIREVLSGGLGAVGRDVREKVKGILDDFKNQLKNAQGDQTLFQHVSTSNLIAGLGLDQKTAKALRERLAGVGAGFTVPQASGQFAGGGGGINFNGPVTMHNHGVEDVAKFESQLRQRERRRPQVTRGRVQ